MSIRFLSKKSIFIALLLPLSGLPPCVADQTFNSPEIDGLPIDKCVAGTGWGRPNNLFNPLNDERCGTESQASIANIFCREMGFSGVSTDVEIAWEISMNWPERHNIWKYARGTNPAQGEWGIIFGGHHFSRITCSEKEQTAEIIEQETKTFITSWH